MSRNPYDYLPGREKKPQYFKKKDIPLIIMTALLGILLGMLAGGVIIGIMHLFT
ncbi:MAG: hypothetical protein II689_03985 [Firmicutes bacterium]|nr:hypothetical protein [Bacillota bacterium]